MSIIFGIAAAALTTGMLSVISNTPIITTEPEVEMYKVIEDNREEERV